MAGVVVPKPPNGVDAWLVAPKALPKADGVGVAEAVGVNPANPVCGLTAVLPTLKGWATPTGAAVVADGAPKEKG